MGKDAVRESLKRVRLRNVRDKSAIKLSFTVGRLPEMHCAYALASDGMHSDSEIRQVPMQGL